MDTGAAGQARGETTPQEDVQPGTLTGEVVSGLLRDFPFPPDVVGTPGSLTAVCEETWSDGTTQVVYDRPLTGLEGRTYLAAQQLDRGLDALSPWDAAARQSARQGVLEMVEAARGLAEIARVRAEVADLEARVSAIAASGEPGVQCRLLPPAAIASLQSLDAALGAGLAPSTASGSVAVAWSYAIVGQLPQGLELDPATGVVSGVPLEEAGPGFAVVACAQVPADGSSPPRTFVVSARGDGISQAAGVVVPAGRTAVADFEGAALLPRTRAGATEHRGILRQLRAELDAARRSAPGLDAAAQGLEEEYAAASQAVQAQLRGLDALLRGRDQQPAATPDARRRARSAALLVHAADVRRRSARAAQGLPPTRR